MFGAAWNFLVDGMGSILAFLYSVIPNYGVAIIGLTVLVRLVLFPLTAKQARSMQKMQLIQPELKKLQAQYKNDRQKLNEEIMKFYKENSVNPMAGCLPLALQMPIFFALYRVLIEPHKHLPVDSNLYQAFCGTAGGDCKPKGLSFLGMDLGEAASKVSGGFADALPYFLLIALVVVTGYLQFKQTQSRQTSQANPQMAIMGKIFPVMFAFISYNMPSGVVLYFLVSNAWQIGQQALIFRTMPAPPSRCRWHGGGDRVGAPADRQARRREAEAEGRDPLSPRRKGGSSGPCGRAASAPAAAASRRGTETGSHNPRPETPGGGRRAAGKRRGAGSGPTVGFTATAQEATPIADRGKPPMEWIVTTGKTVAEAVEAALDELGVDEADIEYEVLEESKRGFLSRLGGGSPARIRARVKPLSREKPDRRRRGGSRDRDRERKGGGDGGERAARAPRPERAPADRPAADRSGSGRPARGRPPAAVDQGDDGPAEDVEKRPAGERAAAAVNVLHQDRDRATDGAGRSRRVQRRLPRRPPGRPAPTATRRKPCPVQR